MTGKPQRRRGAWLRALRTAAALVGMFAAGLAFAQSADVQVSAYTWTPDPIVNGSGGTFTLQFTNNGPDAAANVVLSVLVSQNVTVGAAPAGCTLGAPPAGPPTYSATLTCNIGTLAANAVQTVVYNVTGNAPGDAQTSAQLATSTTDPNSANNALTKIVTVAFGADLAVGAKTPSATSQPAGFPLSFTLAATNQGPDAASQVRITDNLPPLADFNAVTAAGANWACVLDNSNAAAPKAVCTYSGAPVTAGGAFPAITVQGTIVKAIAGTITNSAFVESLDINVIDFNAANNTNINPATGLRQPVTVNVLPGTDIAASKVVLQAGVPATQIVSGSAAVFRIGAMNNGPQQAAGVTVSDSVPAGWTIGVLPAGCSVAGQSVTCNAGTVNAGAALSFDIPVTAPVVGAAAAVSNTATVIMTAPPSANDVNQANNSATVNFTVTPPFADLSISKSKSPNPALAGQTVTNTLRVTNAANSTSPATGTIRVTEAIQSANEQYVGFAGAGWSCAPAAGPLVGPTTITCDFAAANLAVGASLPDLVITTQVIPGLPPGVVNIPNQACTGATAGSPHSPTDNNAGNDCQGQSTVATTRIADIGLAKSASVGTVTSATNSFTYTVTVSNSPASPDTVPTVVVNDPVPMFYNDPGNAGTTGVAASVSGGLGAGESCSTGATVSCTLRNLAPGASRSITITVTRPFNSGSLTNTATWSSPDSVQAANVLPDSAQATVTVDPVADVSMEGKTSTPEPVQVGVELTYTLSFKNKGPSAAAGVVVKDPFDPTRFDYVAASASITGPGGGACAIVADLGASPVSADPNYAAQQGLRCDGFSLANGETRQIIYKVIPKHPYPGGTPNVFTNRAKISTTTAESSAANNDIARVVNVAQPQLDLRVSKSEKTPPGDPVAFGNDIVYLVTVRNNGPSIATNVLLLDTPSAPPGFQMTYTSVAIDGSSTYTPPSPACVAPPGANQPVTCKLHGTNPAQNFLPANTAVVFELTFATGPPASNPTNSLTYSNTAVVSSQETIDGFDTSPTNNTAIENTTVLPKVDLEVIDKAASKPALNVNEPFTYTIRIRNKGPSIASSAELTDVLPAGFQKAPGAIVVTPGAAVALSTNTCSGTTTISCTLGPLPVDAGAVADVTKVVTITVPVRAVFPFAGPFGVNIANTASIAPTTGSALDLVPGNNSASTAVQVQKSSLAGTVYADNNRSNAIDAGEGLSGVTLTLSGTDIYGNAISTSVASGAGGAFLLDNLPPGSYSLIETQPAGYFDRNETAGSAGGTVDNSSYGAAAGQNTIANVTLPAASAATGYVFQEYQAASVTGFYYEDVNNNGLHDPGEPGIGAGATVTLTGTDYAGNPVNLVATVAAGGQYTFSSVPPDNGVAYTLTQTAQPAGYLDGREQQGPGNPLAIATAGRNAPESITGVTVNPGAALTEHNFGELRSSTIAGSVYADINGNGVRDDPPESFGIPGVTITLTGTNDLGQPVSCTTLTNGAGAYAFPAAGAVAPCDALRPGTYTVTQTKPAGLTSTGAQTGTVNGTGSGSAGANAATQFVQNIVVPNSGSTGVNYNFGHQGTLLSGSVYVDANGNGVRDPGEPGIAGVSVTLSGNAQGGQAICAIYPSCTAVTDAGGNYVFSNIPASDASGYGITERNDISPILASFADGAEQRGTVAGVPVGTVGNDVISGVVIALGQIGANYNFGERGAALAGSVYVDANDNGIREGAEQPLAGVTLTLSGTTTSGANVCAVIVSCTVLTDAAGAYAFANLPVGSYTITETQPAAFADGRESAGSFGGTVDNSAFTALPQNNRVSAITVPVGGSGSGYNFGEKVGTLSGRVCVDADNNGCQPGEAGIAGVTLTLTGTDAQGNPVNQTVTTDAGGSYVFAALHTANGAGYIITETQPAAYLDGKQSKGTIGAAACAACDIATLNQIKSIPYDAAQSATGFDFGELLPASLAGSVYHDVNASNAKDSGEGLPGVTVTLNGTDDRGNAVTLTTVTDANGSYSFGNLRPGTYSVTETQPAGINDGATVAGSAGGTAGVNTITAIVLNPGIAGLGYDFRDTAASLGGSVYLDANNNGARDGGEQGIAGVTVTLSGTQTRSAQTDAQGNYLFAGLIAGTYTLTETQPVVFQDGTDRLGNAGGTLGNDVFSNIVLPAGTQGSGYLFGERPGLPGQIAGTVWFNSLVRDNVQQSGEPGQAGWAVELLRGGTVVASTLTDANGNYSLANVPAGAGYELVFRHPGNNAVYGNASSPNPVPGATYGRTISNLTVASGANFINQNLPVDPSGVLYNPLTGAAVAGANVTLVASNCSAAFDPAAHLLGGPGNLSQVTGADGFYQFFLLPGAPTCTFTLQITVPAGFLPGPSVINPPQPGVLTVGAVPNPLLVTPSNLPPAPGTVAPYFLAFVIGGASADVLHNHIPIDPILAGAIFIQKTTPLVNVSRGDLVPYTITATNTTAATIPNIDVRDQLPPGFRYVAGSATLNGAPLAPSVAGRNLAWANQSFAPRERKVYKIVLAVGSGVGEGDYLNSVVAVNNIAATAVSNTATATVRIVPDPTFDCSDLIGKVFDDRNANGYQDDGEPGIADVRVVTVRGLLVRTDAEGRFHIACADIPQADHGSNFVLKLDERTLPSGYRLTTENPHSVRTTRGKMVRLNFGATIHRVVRVEVADAAFMPGDTALRPEWQARIDKLPEQLRDRPSVVRVAYTRAAETETLVRKRVEALIASIRSRWEQQRCCYALTVEDEARAPSQ